MIQQMPPSYDAREQPQVSIDEKRKRVFEDGPDRGRILREAAPPSPSRSSLSLRPNLQTWPREGRAVCSWRRGRSAGTRCPNRRAGRSTACRASVRDREARLARLGREGELEMDSESERYESESLGHGGESLYGGRGCAVEWDERWRRPSASSASSCARANGCVYLAFDLVRSCSFSFRIRRTA